MTNTTAPAAVEFRDLRDLKVWVSGAPKPDTIALLRDLGALPLTKADILAEHFDDEVEAAQACVNTLLGSSVLVHAGAPDPVEVLLAQASGLRVLDLAPR